MIWIAAGSGIAPFRFEYAFIGRKSFGNKEKLIMQIFQNAEDSGNNDALKRAFHFTAHSSQKYGENSGSPTFNIKVWDLKKLISITIRIL